MHTHIHTLKDGDELRVVVVSWFVLVHFDLIGIWYTNTGTPKKPPFLPPATAMYQSSTVVSFVVFSVPSFSLPSPVVFSVTCSAVAAGPFVALAMSTEKTG